jgi:hypothetical protein
MTCFGVSVAGNLPPLHPEKSPARLRYRTASWSRRSQTGDMGDKVNPTRVRYDFVRGGGGAAPGGGGAISASLITMPDIGSTQVR